MIALLQEYWWLVAWTFCGTSPAIRFGLEHDSSFYAWAMFILAGPVWWVAYVGVLAFTLWDDLFGWAVKWVFRR